MAPTDARYLVLSDMHFGTPESSVNEPRTLDALVGHMVARAPWEEIVLTGDLLDVNLSTLTRAIEGGPNALFGFRDFVERLDAKMKESGKAGLADLAGRWVYVPGNHDYKIWDLLSAKVACDDVLARGDPMGTVRTPLTSHRWDGDQSFFAGIFRRAGVQDRVTVSYPNHEVAFGGGKTMLFTHGHYLDPSQTRGHDLTANLRGVTDRKQVDAIVRRIFIEAAQYQAIATAVSFTKSTIRIVDDLFGPDGFANKVHKIVARVGGWILRHLTRKKAALRGQELSKAQLSNIDYYVDEFCRCSPRPSWFVFGHTHRQGQGRSARHEIEVFNVGSCYPDGDKQITFLEVEAGAGVPTVQLMCVDGKATVRRS